MPILRILCLKIGQRRHEDEMPKGEVISAPSLTSFAPHELQATIIMQVYGDYSFLYFLECLPGSCV